MVNKMIHTPNVGKLKSNTIKSTTTTNLPSHELVNCVNKTPGNREKPTVYSTPDIRILRIFIQLYAR